MTSTADLKPYPERQEISDEVKSEPVVEATFNTRSRGHYSLQNKVSTPQRLMVIQSCWRSSFSERGSDIVNLSTRYDLIDEALMFVNKKQ